MQTHKSTSSIKGNSLAIVTLAIMIAAIVPGCLAQVTEAASAPNTMASVSRVAADGKTLHVTVGHSIFVDTQTRLRRVYVADPAVLSSVTLTPTEIIVTAMSAGISSLTLLDETGQAQSYVVSSDIDIDGLRTAMSQATRGDAVKVEGSGARVTLSGIVATEAIADSAVKLAGLYSKEVANALTVIPGHPKQVRLQVRIIEVDRSKALQLGINLFNPGGNTSFLAQTTTSQFPTTATLGGASTGGAIGSLAVSNPLNFMLYSAKLNLGATIQDLQAKQVLQILAEPTITTISGQKADFLSGGEFPFPIVQPGGSGGAPVVTVSFRPYGVKVDFTPIVNEDGTVRLKVDPEVSALDYTNSVTIGGFTVPALSTRRASTEVELRSDQSFAISGLLDQRTTDILNKDPGAASIPILGYLFKSKSSNRSTTELVIVVTPTVVDPLTETGVPSQPELPIPTLSVSKFDKELGKNHNPQPAAPPITPDHPPINPPLFPGSAPTPPPAAAPAATLHNAPAQSAQAQPDVPTPAPLNAAAIAVTPATAKQLPTSVPATSIPAPAPAQKETASVIHSPKNQRIAKSEIVEVMTVSHESDAEAMVAALNRCGYNVAVDHDAKTSLVHLDIGPFTNKMDAETMRQRLLLDGYNATIKELQTKHL